MSVKTAAQSFEHKTIPNNLTPKPYGGGSNSNGGVGSSKKPKTLEKPSFLSNNNNNKPLIVNASELSSFKFNAKTTANTNNNANKNNTASGQDTAKAEFQQQQRVPLKKKRQPPPTESVTGTDTKPIKKAPPSVSKKPPPPPTDEELTVRHVEEKSADQLKNEKELMKLPSGAVRNSKLMLFEKLSSKDADVAPTRRRTSTSASKNSRTGSVTSNSSVGSTGVGISNATGDNESPLTTAPNISPKMSTFKVGQQQLQQQQQKMIKPNSLPRSLLENNNSTFNKSNTDNKPAVSKKLSSNAPSPSISPPETTSIKINYDQLEQEGNYDDVSTPVSPTGPPPIAFAAPVAPLLMAPSPNNNYDIYDDVEQDNGEIYDDVAAATGRGGSGGNIALRPAHIPSRPSTAQPPPPPSQEGFYDDVQGSTSFPPPRPSHFVNVISGDEIYDDVDTATGIVPQEIDDDVDTSFKPATSPSTPSTQQQFTMRPGSAVSPRPPPSASASSNSSSSFAPLKTEKTFAPLPLEKFKMPHGLDQWLKDMLTAHHARLKNCDNSEVIPPRMPITPASVQGILG